MDTWNIPKARPLGRVAGKPVHRFKVVVTQDGLDRDLWHNEEECEVIARSAAEAVDLVREEVAHKVSHPTEIATRGPQGSTVRRFIGWEAMVWAGMCHVDRHQLELGI